MYWFRSLSWGPFVYACLIDFHLILLTLKRIELPDVETKRKQTYFQERWLSVDEYATWLMKYPS